MNRAALGLGLFSVGLGLGELVAPRSLARLIGVEPKGLTAPVMRGFGAREVVVGAGLLSGRSAAPWLWGRVAGDLLDLAALAYASRRMRGRRGRSWGALAAVAGVTALDTFAAIAATRARNEVAPSAPVRKAITIARRRSDVYRFWRDVANAPLFMADIVSVEALDDRRSRWSARGPVGPVVRWESVIDEDVPDQRLSWRSAEGSDVQAQGAVTFDDAPDGRGTEVRLTMRYAPRHAALAPAARFLWKVAAAPRMDADLRRCKQVLEAGHVVHSDASLHRGMHPARPSTAATASREGQP